MSYNRDFEQRTSAEGWKDPLHVGRKSDPALNADYTKDYPSGSTIAQTSMTTPTSTMHSETFYQQQQLPQQQLSGAHNIREEGLLTLPAHRATGHLEMEGALPSARLEVPEHAAPAKFIIPAHEEKEILSVPSHQAPAELYLPDQVASGTARIREHEAPAAVSVSGGRGTGEVKVAGFHQTVPINIPGKVGSAMVSVQGTETETNVSLMPIMQEASLLVPGREEQTHLHVIPQTQNTSVLVPEQSVPISLPGCPNQILNIKIPAHSRPEVVSTSGVDLAGRVVIGEHMEQAQVAVGEVRQHAHVRVAPHTVAAAVTVPETSTNAVLEVAPTTVPANLVVNEAQSRGRVIFNEQLEGASLQVKGVREQIPVNVMGTSAMKSRTVAAVETDTMTEVPAQIMQTNVSIPARSKDLSFDVPAEQARVDVIAREEGMLSSQLQSMGIQQIGETELACVPSNQTAYVEPVVETVQPMRQVIQERPSMIETTQEIIQTESLDREGRDHHHLSYPHHHEDPNLYGTTTPVSHTKPYSTHDTSYTSTGPTTYDTTTGGVQTKKSFGQKLKEKLHIGHSSTTTTTPQNPPTYY